MGARHSKSGHRSKSSKRPAQPAASPAPGPSSSAAPHPSAAMAAQLAATLSPFEQRCVGSMLGKFCGDVLGAAVEGWDVERIRAAAPDGLRNFIMGTDRGDGCYTDDTQMAIALARSLVAGGGRCEALAAARAYADEYDMARGYGGTAYKILMLIRKEGVDEESLASLGTCFIPGGSFGNGGAMRIAPLGLVYRHAPPAVLREAVAAALRVTHVHPTAIDGAFVIALAVGYLATHAPPPAELAPAEAAAGSAAGDGGGQAASVSGLFDHLLAQQSLMETPAMVQKLQAVRSAVLQAAPLAKAPGQGWAAYFASGGWRAELELHDAVSEAFQIRADDAAAVALAALTFHWGRPRDAVVASVHYGGDTDTIAAIVGGMAGALYGVGWLPDRWLGVLENGNAGRDDVVALARQLAQFDTRS
ncbi:hypothetical protein HYH02_008617 [Chlamydomonas schloesseri]|uniref:ADP-ribosylhydrolase ARH3 n=1 Tax=Chlamydomonas schloesseri TaxID=2026947 RepID=A0A836B294_9CHLO|nr:hypothetical protein HYH02_008617 [Chlamydomonas schloesseri]|eukprot:KAG2445149.1 hypothetical protein HYH02_008617 [Chlamydomonas schloesseri]